MATSKATPMSFHASDLGTVFRKNGAALTTAQSSFTQKWTDSVTYGDNIPGWRELIRRGANATTSLNGSRITYRYKPGSFRHIATPAFVAAADPTAFVLYEAEGLLSLSPDAPTGNPALLSDTKANNAALSSFVRKLEAVNTSFHGGVFLGELTQTLHGIRNPALGLRRLVDTWGHRALKLRSSRKVKFPTVQSLHKALAETWLEHAFHWKPLLSDIDDAAKTLAEINTNQALSNSRISATGSASEQLITPTVHVYVNGGLSWLRNFVSTGDTQVTYRGAVIVNARNSILMAPRLLGFNPASFVPTVWELMPYSFLIDYFTNIGDILSGWSHNTSELSWCNRTVRREIVYKYFVTERTDATYPFVSPVTGRWTTSMRPAEVEVRKTSVSRSTYVGNFAGTFEFEIPGLGSKKWLNIAALIAGRSSDRSFKYGD
jgi:hypothetical protein